MSTRDRVKLTALEREQLAAMQAMLEASDPELAQVLKGRQAGTGTPPDAGPGADRHRSPRRRHRAAARSGGVPCPVPKRSSSRGAGARSWRAATWRGLRRAGTARWAAPGLVAIGVALAVGASIAGTRPTGMSAMGMGPLRWLSIVGAAAAGAGLGLCVLALRRRRSVRTRDARVRETISRPVVGREGTAPLD